MNRKACSERAGVPQGIVVFGANGCGKTTLGRALAKALRYRHMDAEDYYFEKSDIHYANPCSKDEAIARMLADINKHGAFVLSAVTGDFGDEITSKYALGVWLSAPTAIRMERIAARSVDKHGARALPGGDLYDDRQRFLAFAQARDLSVIDKWAGTLACPVLCIDATDTVKANVRRVLLLYRALT